MTQRKSQILTTAARLFKERGYSAVTMRDLAAALDMKAASLYNHISGKQEILTILILEVAHEFTNGMKQVESDDSTAFVKAQNLIALHIKIALSLTDSLAVLNNDWMHLEGVSYEEYIRLRKNYEADFKQIILEGIDKGEFKNMSVETILFNLLSTLRSIYLWIPKKSPSEIETLKVELPDLLLLGLKK
ncbi:transcriptional regulator [Nonlabens tegetincola]|uniref:Transcriptional regulator n=1 Tax=Nonlabens tegetincola TaxID=323273 RepID=A0A090Q4A6_9FLAO|nr:MULTISPECIES: TetR/AcrR family transcriptional regulator [Nonlabens]ALM20579.1 TetR family transcriptional regulator [Nonlabens sp. MIC269]ARN70364.1 TetR family transcriptional regulator [Nonlabens tegetincola]PQJ19228.1 TetR family transcriptional regulator [Nonlabens tegetincola]GAK97929.1 transcriptional regulator [Nonlabens tegetincola]